MKYLASLCSARCEMKFAPHICEANISQRSYFTWALPNFTRRRRISLKKAHLRCRCAFFWRRHPDLNWGIKVLQTSALPLGYGAGYNEDRTSRSSLWSGLRGSNPPPRPWQGRALPNELNPHINGASGRNRTNDTGIFSPLLYQLSYRGICLPFL